MRTDGASATGAGGVTTGGRTLGAWTAGSGVGRGDGAGSGGGLGTAGRGDGVVSDMGAGGRSGRAGIRDVEMGAGLDAGGLGGGAWGRAATGFSGERAGRGVRGPSVGAGRSSGGGDAAGGAARGGDGGTGGWAGGGGGAFLGAGVVTGARAGGGLGSASRYSVSETLVPVAGAWPEVPSAISSSRLSKRSGSAEPEVSLDRRDDVPFAGVPPPDPPPPGKSSRGSPHPGHSEAEDGTSSPQMGQFIAVCGSFPAPPVPGPPREDEGFSVYTSLPATAGQTLDAQRGAPEVACRHLVPNRLVHEGPVRSDPTLAWVGRKGYRPSPWCVGRDGGIGPSGGP